MLVQKYGAFKYLAFTAVNTQMRTEPWVVLSANDLNEAGDLFLFVVTCNSCLFLPNGDKGIDQEMRKGFALMAKCVEASKAPLFALTHTHSLTLTPIIR